ncbi:uncharacterized protein LOC143064495 [Mytilus galloprovincialis]|uniref:Uncharacterized protein n=1 Tax=Mytilus galloprovincialis TaxID=29158 RepID=A0A8B6EC38_MYTGA|nr:Hypothetical predicted protein [Mytilus galloprovincialis]
MSTNYYPKGSSRGGSEMGDSEMGSAFELQKWPSYYSSQASMTYSHRSFYSTYTPSHASTFLPIVQQAPDKLKKPDDNFGLACCSIAINPIFGIIAVLLAEISRGYFNRCNYIKASKYGAYAKATAAGGIFCTIFLLACIISQLLWYHLKFSY